MNQAARRSLSPACTNRGVGVVAFLAALLLASLHCGQAADAHGSAPARGGRPNVGALPLGFGDLPSVKPFGVAPLNQPQTTSPYAQAVLSDSPTIYYRLDETGGPVAQDSSGNEHEGAYQEGVTYGAQGAIASDPSDDAISATGLAVTQSGATLPAGNSARTMEFWVRGGVQNPIAFTYGGEGGTNDQFRVTVFGGELWLSVDSGHGYGSAQYAVSLPQAWWDGNWHLFDVTYDGAKALGYMDGQLVGNFGVRTPLATVTGTSPLHVGDRGEVGDGDHAYDLDEFAIYPTALTPEQIDEHWSLGGSAAPACMAAPTSPYPQAVLKDSPSLYLRLGDPGGDPGHYVAYDASGRCTADAPTNGAYTTGVGSVQGATLGDTDNAISATGLAVTQSGATLPAGNSARTMEFWVRGGVQNPIAFTYGGEGGTNDQFRVTVFGGELWLTVDGSHGYGSAQYAVSLPQAWWDGNWHLFDVTYDGTRARGYMDGQLLGSFGVLTPLATVTGTSPLRIGDRGEVGDGNNAYSLDEFAIYPTALSPEQVDAHWTAQSATPPGMSVIAGTAMIGGGGGAQGVRVQACPASGGSCTVDPYPVDGFGFFHFLVPNGTYTVTIFAPAGSPDGPKTIGPLALPPSALHLSATFGAPGSLPENVSLSSPGRGTQEHVVPGLNWGEPSTVTVNACKGGVGLTSIAGTNTSTGQPETVSSPLLETPTGSGSYQAAIRPLAPVHGGATGTDVIDCPAKLGLVPSGGPPSGGTTVLLNAPGGLTGATAVDFGTTPASSFTLLTDNFIAATAPPGSGSVAVTVTGSGGNTLPIGTYTYLQVASLSTGSGPAAGGTSVTINGQGFSPGANVVFGLVPAQSVTYISPTQLQVIAPAGVGTVDVQVVQGTSVSAPAGGALFVNTGGQPGTSGFNEFTTSAQAYAQDVSQACSVEVAGVTLAEQDAQLCGAAEFAKDVYEEGIDTLKDTALEPVTDWAGREAGALFSDGVAKLFSSYAAGAFVFNLIPFIGEIWDAYQTVQFMVELGNDACKLLVGTDCRWDFWNLFIDPSGTVVDTNGNPIDGATTTLLEQPLASGPFMQVAASSGAIEPAENPEKTGTSGQFDWNALAGNYEVEASAPGCHAPKEEGQPNVFTSPFTLPPPAVGLVLTLECPTGTAPTPTVTGLSAVGGSTAGGEIVDISGEGLTDVTAVHFGAKASVHVQPLSPYAVAAVAPAGGGTVDVTVSGPGGTSATSEADRYIYSMPLVTASSPVVESVAPGSGPLSGGTAVTIKGNHLGAFAVQFGGTAATQVTAVSESEIQAVAPAGAFPARVDITVTTSAGSSAPTLADGFVYGSPPPPVATSVTLTPSEGTAARGQTVTLKATVAPTDGGGSLAFYADGSNTPLSNCGAQALTPNGGAYQASCSTSSLALGGHTLSATYSGDASYAGGAGATSVSILPNAEEEEEEEATLKAEAEAKKKAEAEAIGKLGEEEAKMKAAVEAAAKRRGEEEAAARKRAEEEKAKRETTGAKEARSKPKPLTRAQLLTRALKACKKDKTKVKRTACEKRAHKQYGRKTKAKSR